MKANFTGLWQFFNRHSGFFKKSLLLLLVCALAGVSRLNAQPYVNLVINPATTNVNVGGSFTVTVQAQFLSANPVDAVQVNISFDNTVLQATAVSNVSPLVSFIGPSFDNGTGIVNFVGVDLSAPFPTSTFDVMTITFTALAVPGGGTTPLTFNRPPTEVASAAVSVLNTVTNAAVNITGVGCTPPTATISAPGGTITCNSQPFNITLSAATGTSPFDLTIDGPGGTATYNDIPVGGIITNFVPPVEKIWPDPLNPVPPTNLDAAYTLGVKFNSSVDGFVKGVRFFSADDVDPTPGNYTGQLWSAGGVLLASGTFTGVTADSWNELLFTTPVFITAGTTYIASYNTNASTSYASTANGLTTAFTNGVLTAEANGGVYNTGAAVVFPGIPPFGGTTNHNYWADVIFSPDEYTFNLTGIKDADECTSAGSLQTLVVTSVDCATLPVTLLNLSASPKEKSINLHWSTATETNNKGFEIQRRSDGADWKVIGFVNGAGNSSLTRHYDYTDQSLSAGKYYYRLRQIDLDGRFDFSPVVSAIIGGAESFRLDQNYPNPFRNETILRFALPQKTNVKLSLFDMHGRLLRVLVNGSRDKGSHAITFNASSLNSGVYYYKLEADHFSEVKKMTVQ